LISHKGEYSSNHFLIDTRGVNVKQSITDIYYLGEQLEKLGFKRRYRLALLHSRNKDLDQFFETTAHNRGHQIRLFDEEKDALEWLKHPHEYHVTRIKQQGSLLPLSAGS